MENREFRQFSDQLRLHTANLANLSIGDSIWSATANNNNNAGPNTNLPPPSSSSAATSDWKMGGLGLTPPTTQKLPFGFPYNSANLTNNLNTNDTGGKGGNFGTYFNANTNTNNDNGQMMKNYFNKAITKPNFNNNNYNNNNNIINNNNNRKNSNDHSGGKKKSTNNNNSNNNNNNSFGSSVDKRFKTLPPSEALPRNEAVGGYIFVCNNDTMQENLKRQLFGLPPRYRDSVRAITPGLPLFLYNYSTHQLHGIFEAASFGGTNIDPAAWEDKKSHGESRFPAQVRVVTRKICEPLEEDSFRPILHHYDGPKFRLELSVPEALALLDIFSETDA